MATKWPPATKHNSQVENMPKYEEPFFYLAAALGLWFMYAVIAVAIVILFGKFFV